MVTVTRLRILRLKHGISITELAKLAGVSDQHISRLELAQVHGTSRQEERVSTALSELIAQRHSDLLALEKDFLLNKGRLLEPLEVEHEL